MNALRKTALHSFHINKLKASPMAEFAGYDMPIQYKDYGIVKESELCRKFASLFDVSHMGQVR
jgi:aminomethyltransferase